MPAIQPALLEQQAKQLAERSTDPKDFVRGLHRLLDYYADRTRRPGQSGLPSPLLTSYRVPSVVIRQIAQALKPALDHDLTAGLALVDALWQEPVLECRLLAAQVLGQLPLETPEAALNRLRHWVCPPPGSKALFTPEAQRMILEAALATCRRQSLAAVLELTRQWLESQQPAERLAGLQVLALFLEDERFENLPVLFRLIQPFLERVPPALRPEVVEVVRLLAHRSPPEAAYLLRQALNHPEHPDTPWLIRQVLEEFPPAQQATLRQELARA